MAMSSENSLERRGEEQLMLIVLLMVEI